MKKNSASTLLAILAIISFLSACVIAALNFTSVLSRNVQRTSALRTATEVGDGALEYAFANWREICRVAPGTQYPTQNFLSTGGAPPIPLPTQTMFPGVSNFTASAGANPGSGAPFTVANFGVQAVDPTLAALATNTTPPPAATGTNITTKSFYYLASADISVPGFAGKIVKANVRRVFKKQQQSPWNYAIFYNDLLEINPGAPQTITGWVHTNGDLYTEMSDLTFNSKVDYGSDWSNGTAWAPGDADHPPAAPAAPTYAANQPPTRGPVQEPFGIDTASINIKNGTNQTDSQVYSQLIAPGVTNPDFGSNSYYNQASIRILVDASNNVTYRNINDAVINSSSTGNDLAMYNAFKAAVSTNSTIQDNREAAAVRVVNIDMSVITSALTPTGSGGSGTLVGKGFNGIIYATDTSATAALDRGIRLKKGAIMPASTGITVASNNAVYIQGDYNTGRVTNAGGTVITETPANANNNNTGSNVVAGYTEQSCAVLGDAVMILSNNWSDALSTSGSIGNTATPTTINTAIVSGIVPTSSAYAGANSYSGGAENFPRFLENWGGQTFTYYGSMVELFQSQQFTGRWGSANVYSPPKRNWNFDTLFYTSPPPGSLLVYSFIQERWFVQ